MSKNRNTPYFGEKSDGGKYDFTKKTRKVYINIIDGTSPYDPLGMYTGVPENPLEKPVQDADDL